MRILVVLAIAAVPGAAHAQCIATEAEAVSCTLSNSGGMTLCWTEGQARLAYDTQAGNPAQVTVPLGDVTGLTASDWASSTLRADGASYEVYLAGGVGGMNVIADAGGSTAYTCDPGTTTGALAALNAAAIHAVSSKEN